MNNLAAPILIAFIAGWVGWTLGIESGESERKDIIASLPAQQAYWQKLEAGLREPDGRDLVCEQIFEAVQQELSEEYTLDASAMNAAYDQLGARR